MDGRWGSNSKAFHISMRLRIQSRSMDYRKVNWME